MPAGFVLKVLAVYDDAFWRADGLSGQSIDFDSPFEITLDISPESGSPGIIGAFAFGPRAMALTTSDARRAAAVKALRVRFGPRAAAPTAVEDLEWATEQWSGGGMMAHFPTGVLTQFGPLLRRPEGRIHWAGTETATISHGTIDGAVRSGQRAAADILRA
jgi:monoamine oxidase